MIRKHYRAVIQENADAVELAQADTAKLKQAILVHRCLTVAMYQHGRQLFLYIETKDDTLSPSEIFPTLDDYLIPWPAKENTTTWKKMYHIYYHCNYESDQQWARHEKKQRRGRIAYLHEDKLFSYVYYHKAIVDEGLLDGDMYQSIALHEDVLFSYFEEPKIFVHINNHIMQPSKVINDWIAQDPESHFDHELSGQENFLLLPEVISMGYEDL